MQYSNPLKLKMLLAWEWLFSCCINHVVHFPGSVIQKAARVQEGQRVIATRRTSILAARARPAYSEFPPGPTNTFSETRVLNTASSFLLLPVLCKSWDMCPWSLWLGGWGSRRRSYMRCSLSSIVTTKQVNSQSCKWDVRKMINKLNATHYKFQNNK